MDPPSGPRGMSNFNAPLAGGGNTRDAPPRDSHGGASSRSGRDYNQRGGDRWNNSRDAPPSSSSRDMDIGGSRDRAPDRDSSRMAGAGAGSRDRDGSGARFRDRDGGSGMTGNRMPERGSDHRIERERMDGGQSFRGDRSSHHQSSGGRGGLDSRSGSNANTAGNPGHHHSSSGRARSPFHSTSSAWSSKGGNGGSGLGVGGSGSSYMSGGAPSSGGSVMNEWNRVGGGMEAGMGGNLGGVGLAPVMRGGVGGSSLPSLGMQAYSGGAGASWGSAMSSMQAKQLQQAAGTLMANITSGGAMLSGNRDRFDGYSSSKSNMNPRRY